MAWKGLLTLMGISFTAAFALRTLKQPTLPDVWLARLAVVIAVCSGVDAVARLVAGERERGRRKPLLRVNQILISMMLDLVDDENQASLRDLDVSVWAKRRTISSLGRRRLHRVHRTRLAHDLLTVRMGGWESGKGAVGTCLLTGEVAHSNVHAEAVRWAERLPTRAEFEGLPHDTRAGFTFQEYSAVVRKYSEVLAVPATTEAGDLLGVVSVDVRFSENFTPFLNTVKTRQVCCAAADLIREDIKYLSMDA